MKGNLTPEERCAPNFLEALTWIDKHPATTLLLVHPRPPASGALLPNTGLSAVPEGFKEFHLFKFKYRS